MAVDRGPFAPPTIINLLPNARYSVEGEAPSPDPPTELAVVGTVVEVVPGAAMNDGESHPERAMARQLRGLGRVVLLLRDGGAVFDYDDSPTPSRWTADEAELLAGAAGVRYPGPEPRRCHEIAVPGGASMTAVGFREGPADSAAVAAPLSEPSSSSSGPARHAGVLNVELVGGQPPARTERRVRCRGARRGPNRSGHHS